MDPEAKSPVQEKAGGKADIKVCGVCGDKALGYNFNAVTCESCKAFFRRNALKNKEFRCPFNKNCDITVITRRFCQHCRLVKCLSIGMRTDYIMSEEDKVMKRNKIAQNRAKKRPLTDRDKRAKIKRELLDDSIDCTTDDLMPQTPAAAYEEQENIQDQNPVSKQHPSTRSWPVDSETYPDDSDRLNTVSPRASSTVDLHHHMVEPFPSPTSATSVPSPSSPPESATVGASQTVEMVSEKRMAGVSVITPPMVCPSASILRSVLGPVAPEPTSDTPLLSSLINAPRDPLTSPPPYHEPPREPVWARDCVGQDWAEPSSSRHRSTVLEVTKETLQDVQRIPIAPNSIESILSEAIKLEFEAYSSLAKSHQNSRELNDAERAKLNELIVANKALHEPLDDDLSTLVGEDCRFKAGAEQHPMLLDVINLTAIAIRRLIKTSKKINAFKNMCQEDQVALLKGGCTELLILRSAMTYDPDKDSWKIPHTQEQLNVKVDVLKEARGNIYEEHQRFLRTFDPRWRTDENIMLILSAITLFTPDRPRVVHHDVIRLEQNSYYYLLRRYLESVYPGCEARSTFLKLIQKISELHRLNDEHVRVYLDVNPRDVEPLLIEIFDLKPH